MVDLFLGFHGVSYILSLNLTTIVLFARLPMIHSPSTTRDLNSQRHNSEISRTPRVLQPDMMLIQRNSFEAKKWPETSQNAKAFYRFSKALLQVLGAPARKCGQ